METKGLTVTAAAKMANELWSAVEPSPDADPVGVAPRIALQHAVADDASPPAGRTCLQARPARDAVLEGAVRPAANHADAALAHGAKARRALRWEMSGACARWICMVFLVELQVAKFSIP